jgi:RNA polymerase sigma-70 factor (ECF subfamily)
LPANDLSDQALIERANRGDDDAFAALYQRHRDWVAALAYRFTGNRDDALDVLQDVFAYFFAKFPGFELTASLKTFLYPTTKHICLTKLRQRRPNVDIDTVAEELVATASSPLRGDLDRALRAVPPLQREILLLRFADDLSLQQIAAALEIPLGTAKSRLHNALEAMRRELER